MSPEEATGEQGNVTTMTGNVVLEKEGLDVGRPLRRWWPLGRTVWWEWSKPPMAMGCQSAGLPCWEREAGTFGGYGKSGQAPQFGLGHVHLGRLQDSPVSFTIDLPWGKHIANIQKIPTELKTILFPHVDFLMVAFFKGHSQIYELMQTRKHGIWGTCSHI